MSGFRNAVNSGKKTTSSRGSCIRERRSAELRRPQRARYAGRISPLGESELRNQALASVTPQPTMSAHAIAEHSKAKKRGQP